MKDKLVLLAKEKGYYSFHTINREQSSGWFIELCLLQKWLREVHKTVVDVFQESQNYQYTGKWKVDISIIGDYQEEDSPNPPIVCDTYELALEHGIYKALELI